MRTGMLLVACLMSLSLAPLKQEQTAPPRHADPEVTITKGSTLVRLTRWPMKLTGMPGRKRRTTVWYVVLDVGCAERMKVTAPTTLSGIGNILRSADGVEALGWTGRGELVDGEGLGKVAYVTAAFDNEAGLEVLVETE